MLAQREGESKTQRIYAEELDKLNKKHEKDMAAQQIEYKKMVARSNNSTRLIKM